MASRHCIAVLTRALEKATVREFSGRGSSATSRVTSRLLRPMPLRTPRRHFVTSLRSAKQSQDPPASAFQGEDSGIPPSKVYDFSDIQSLSEKPSPDRIIIDVREPSELLSTGRIPGSHNMPISSSPDSFFLPAEEFEDKFGFPKPGKEQEVIFYCKAGVRSKAAAKLAGQAGFGGKIGEYPGSWIDWEKRGGEAER